MPMIAKTASPDKAWMQPPRPVDPPRKETRIGLAFVEQFRAVNSANLMRLTGM
jgi:hypothetical protein